MQPDKKQVRFIAEREGFEPPEVLPSTVFKTVAIDHSAISPWLQTELRALNALNLLKSLKRP